MLLAVGEVDETAGEVVEAGAAAADDEEELAADSADDTELAEDSLDDTELLPPMMPPPPPPPLALVLLLVVVVVLLLGTLELAGALELPLLDAGAAEVEEAALDEAALDDRALEELDAGGDEDDEAGAEDEEAGRELLDEAVVTAVWSGKAVGVTDEELELTELIEVVDEDVVVVVELPKPGASLVTIGAAPVIEVDVATGAGELAGEELAAEEVTAELEDEVPAAAEAASGDARTAVVVEAATLVELVLPA